MRDCERDRERGREGETWVIDMSMKYSPSFTIAQAIYKSRIISAPLVVLYASTN